MKHIRESFLILGLFVASTANAHDYREYSHVENTEIHNHIHCNNCNVYQHPARVEPPVVVYREAPPVVVYREVYSSNTGGTVYNDNSGAIIGAITGGLIGNTVGRGNGRVASSAVGAAIGAIVGDRLQNRR